MLPMQCVDEKSSHFAAQRDMIHYITGNGIGNAWVANELSGLTRAGVPFVLHTMRQPDSTYHLSEWANRISRETRAIYPLPALRMVVSVLLAPLLFRGRFFSGLFNALFGRREHMRARIAALSHFFAACHWARCLRRDDVSHIHSQWIHSNGTIGFYGARLLGCSFSFTAHACDMFRDRVALLDKIDAAEFIVCISEFHRDFFIKHGADPEKLVIVYCGIDPTVFTPTPLEPIAGRPMRIRSSGRLVEKKGFAELIDACRVLADRGEEFECVIGGSGPLESELRAKIEAAGLSDRIELTGEALKQEEITPFVHACDMYVLPCVWASDDDVDGLPQMLMEAMASGRPVISTRLVGIPDLVIDGETGLLVAPNDVEALADAIVRMRDDEALRNRLAEAGLAIVHDKFNLGDCLEPLLDQYRRKLGMPVTHEAQASPADPAVPSNAKVAS